MMHLLNCCLLSFAVELDSLDIIENSTLNIPIKLRLAKVHIEKKLRNTNLGYKCHTKYCTEIWHILQLFC